MLSPWKLHLLLLFSTSSYRVSFLQKKREVRVHSVADNVHDAVAPCVTVIIWKQCRVLHREGRRKTKHAHADNQFRGTAGEELVGFDEDVEVIVRSGQAPVRLAIVFCLSGA